MEAAARLRAPAHPPRPSSRGGVRRARARAQHDAATAAVPPGLERWRGEVALVTGASSGIGREVAARLCAAGMNVVGAARRADGMIGLEEAHPHNFEARSLDVTDPSSVADLFASMPGKVSVLVNAAGLGKQGPLLGEEPEGSRKPGGADARTISAWKRTLETNVLGLARHQIRHLSHAGACGTARSAQRREWRRAASRGPRDHAWQPVRASCARPGEYGWHVLRIKVCCASAGRRPPPGGTRC